MVCSLFGNSDASNSIKPLVYDAIINLIKNEKVDTFLIGNNGNFDRITKAILTELYDTYPHIKITVCLAYLPTNQDADLTFTVYPEGLESVPKRFAIIRRNQWMIEQSQFVVIYMKHTCSNTAKIAEIAETKNKRMIYLDMTL